MKKITALLFLIPLLATLDASATTIRAFSTHDMVREAAIVVRGSIVGQRSLWNQDKTLIVTETTVTVTETLVGRTQSKTVIVRQLGGEVDGLSLSVPGTAKLKKGHHVLLFLRRDAKFHYLVGMAQGHYAVRKTKHGEEVSRNIDNLHLITKKLGRRVGHRAAPSHTAKQKALTYKAFKAQIRKYAKALGRK